MRPRLPDLFVAFDTETTGLSPIGDRVVEIAAASFRSDGYVVGEFECLVDPGIPIPAELTRIHGITDEMVEGRPSVEEVLPEFLRFVADSVLVAHNAPYDVAMLMLPLIRMRGRSAPRPPGNLVLDTCALARVAFPGAANYRLSTMVSMLGIERGRAHRAQPDVTACRQLFLRILQRSEPLATLDDIVRMNGGELRFGFMEEALDPGVAPGPPGGGSGLLREAMKSASPVTIQYQGGTKGYGPRLVTPITVLSQGSVTYVVAHCHLDSSLKNFRLDKIACVHPPGTGLS